MVTAFATGLHYPVAMTTLADGSLLFTGGDGSPNFFSGNGRIYRLQDVDNDGVADDAPEVFYADLPGKLTGMSVVGDLLFVTGEARWLSR